MHSVWEGLSQYWVFGYYYSSNMLIASLSSGQDRLQLYFDTLSPGNWAIWNRRLKYAVDAVGQIVPTRMFIYIATEELHKCGLGICPIVMKIHSLVSVNAASKTHPTHYIRILRISHFTVFKEKKRQNKYHRRFSLAVHSVSGLWSEAICSALRHFGLGIGHPRGDFCVFIYQNGNCGLCSMWRQKAELHLNQTSAFLSIWKLYMILHSK